MKEAITLNTRIYMVQKIFIYPQTKKIKHVFTLVKITSYEEFSPKNPKSLSEDPPQNFVNRSLYSSEKLYNQIVHGNPKMNLQMVQVIGLKSGQNRSNLLVVCLFIGSLSRSHKWVAYRIAFMLNSRQHHNSIRSSILKAYILIKPLQQNLDIKDLGPCKLFLVWRCESNCFHTLFISYTINLRSWVDKRKASYFRLSLIPNF